MAIVWKKEKANWCPKKMCMCWGSSVQETKCERRFSLNDISKASKPLKILRAKMVQQSRCFCWFWTTSQFILHSGTRCELGKNRNSARDHKVHVDIGHGVEILYVMQLRSIGSCTDSPSLDSATLTANFWIFIAIQSKTVEQYLIVTFLFQFQIHEHAHSLPQRLKEHDQNEIGGNRFYRKHTKNCVHAFAINRSAATTISARRSCM